MDVVQEPKPDVECTVHTHHPQSRSRLLGVALLLNTIFASAAIICTIMLLAPKPHNPPSTTSITHPNLTDSIVVRNSTERHIRRQVTTSCLLGFTEAEVYTFVDTIGKKP